MKFAVLFTLLFSLNLFADAEITGVMGSPNLSLDFTKDFIIKDINLLEPSDRPERELATQAFYLTKLHGALEANSVAIVNDKGGSTADLLMKGFAVGAQFSKIVFTNLGPISNFYCDDLSRMTDVVFVFVAGNSGQKLDPSQNPKCKAGNILFVTALDQTAGDLFEQSNYGPYVRIAVASREIKTMGVDGELIARTSVTLGQAIVVGKLAAFSRENPTYLGEKLVAEFLKQKTTKIEKIADRIPDGLAVLE